jgi:ubiquinone/menaquinone biosynthesis C-methylase UbiE
MAPPLDDPPGLESALKLFLKYGLVTDPWLTFAGSDSPPDASLQHQGERLASELMAEPIPRSDLSSWPIVDRWVADAIREVWLSSAAFDTYLQYGCPTVLPSTAQDAERRVRLLVREGGLSALIKGYVLTAPVENLMAVRFYRRMKEEDFISGRLHRPFLQRSLDLELAMGMGLGYYELVNEGGQRWVCLTRRGQQAWREVRRLWDVTGYRRMRSRLLMVAQFARFGDLDEVADAVLPQFPQLRRAFLDYAGPWGPQVLEVGSGTGALTVDAGLAQQVAPGQLTCLDPSPVMTATALEKVRAAGITNTRFVQGVAESMPFPDASFHDVVGFAVFQYVDRARAFAEAFRVLEPGGHLAVCVPLPMPAFQSPLIRRWFKALKDPSYGDVTFCQPDDVPRHAAAAGFESVDVRQVETCLDLGQPEYVVRIMLQMQIYQATLDEMPYQARLDLERDLVGRGRYLLERGYSARTTTPFQWSRWRKPTV